MTSPSPLAGETLYKSLRQGEIRLVEVVPDASSGQFHCDLHTVILAEVKQGYQTLSYVWGDPTDQVEVSINNTSLAITRGLFDFLRIWDQRRTSSWENGELRQAGNRFIWIDAICINQQDVKERSAQVAVMHNIYSLSRCTISWLGASVDICDEHLLEFKSLAGAISQLKEDDPPSLAVKHTLQSNLWKIRPGAFLEADAETPYSDREVRVQDFSEYSLAQTSTWDGLAKYVFQNAKAERHRINKGGMSLKVYTRTGSVWKTFQLLAQHDYWWRVWVRQEIMLSADVVLWHGQTQSSLLHWLIIANWLPAFTAHKQPEAVDNIIWELLINIRLRGSSYGYFLNIRGDCVMPFVSLDDVNGRSQSHSLSRLRGLLVGAKHTKATDPRDKVFALVGLSGATQSPDYSLSIEQVYINLVKKVWVEAQDASFLTVAGSYHENEKYYDRSLGHRLFLPSWVPNWDMLGYEKITGSSQMAGDSSAGLPLASMKLHGLESVLEIQAFLVGTITLCECTRLEEGAFMDRLMDYLYNTEHFMGYDHPGQVEDRGKSILSVLCTNHEWEAEIPQCQAFGSEHKRKLASSYLFLIVCIWTRTDDVQPARPLRQSDHTGSRFRAIFANEDDGLDWTADELNILDAWLLDPPVPIGVQQLGMLFHEPFMKLRVSIESKKLMAIGSSYLGWAPSDAGKGDSVWIVPGCPAPVVFRQIDEEADYTHIGPCFIPGLMNGEMARDVLHSNAETIEMAMRTIHLR